MWIGGDIVRRNWMLVSLGVQRVKEIREASIFRYCGLCFTTNGAKKKDKILSQFVYFGKKVALASFVFTPKASGTNHFYCFFLGNYTFKSWETTFTRKKTPKPRIRETQIRKESAWVQQNPGTSSKTFGLVKHRKHGNLCSWACSSFGPDVSKGWWVFARTWRHWIQNKLQRNFKRQSYTLMKQENKSF